MGSYRGGLFIKISFMLTIFFISSSLQLASATRPLLLQSLQSGPVPPSGASQCSHIPGTGVCINEMNFAGPSVHPPPPPAAVIHSAAASLPDESNEQDPSS